MFHVLNWGFWNQVSHDHRIYERNLKQLRIEAWKTQDFNGVWIRDLALPLRRSNQLSYEATNVGCWSFVSSNERVKNGCEVIYEMIHILGEYITNYLHLKRFLHISLHFKLAPVQYWEYENGLFRHQHYAVVKNNAKGYQEGEKKGFQQIFSPVFAFLFAEWEKNMPNSLYMMSITWSFWTLKRRQRNRNSPTRSKAWDYQEGKRFWKDYHVSLYFYCLSASKRRE